MFRKTHPILGTRNIKQAIEFYVQRLGFQLAFQDNTDTPNYVGFRRDQVELHMQFQYEHEMSTIRLRFLVDDPDALFSEYQQRGVECSASGIRAARSDLRTIPAYLALFTTTPFEISPNLAHLYSNAGYIVLGAIIENVTGRSHYDHIRQSIYQPAAMADSDHYEMDVPIANRATGYTTTAWFGPNDGLRRSNHFTYAVKGSPASNVFSTVQDLLGFFQVLQAHQLLDAAHTNLCLTPHVSCG